MDGYEAEQKREDKRRQAHVLGGALWGLFLAVAVASFGEHWELSEALVKPLVVAALTAPTAFALWRFRNTDKLSDLANAKRGLEAATRAREDAFVAERKRAFEAFESAAHDLQLANCARRRADQEIADLRELEAELREERKELRAENRRLSREADTHRDLLDRQEVLDQLASVRESLRQKAEETTYTRTRIETLSQEHTQASWSASDIFNTCRLTLRRIFPLDPGSRSADLLSRIGDQVAKPGDLHGLLMSLRAEFSDLLLERRVVSGERFTPWVALSDSPASETQPSSDDDVPRPGNAGRS